MALAVRHSAPAIPLFLNNSFFPRVISPAIPSGEKGEGIRRKRPISPDPGSGEMGKFVTSTEFAYAARKDAVPAGHVRSAGAPPQLNSAIRRRRTS